MAFETVTAAELHRNLDIQDFKSAYNVMVLKPTHITYNCEVKVLVLFKAKLVAIIPLHKRLLIENIRWFKGCFCHTSMYRENDNLEVRIEFPFEPEYLCLYFTTIYATKIELTDKNVVALYWTSDYFNDAKLLARATQYLNDYITENILLDVWRYCERLDDLCISFLRKNSVKDTVTFNMNVTKLPAKRLYDFGLRTIDILKPLLFLQVQISWIQTNPTDDYVSVIMGTDYSKFTRDEKFDFFNGISASISEEKSLSLYKHIFNKSGEQDSTSASLGRLLKFLKPSPTAVLEIKDATDDRTISGALDDYARSVAKNTANTTESDTNGPTPQYIQATHRFKSSKKGYIELEIDDALMGVVRIGL